MYKIFYKFFIVFFFLNITFKRYCIGVIFYPLILFNVNTLNIATSNLFIYDIVNYLINANVLKLLYMGIILSVLTSRLFIKVLLIPLLLNYFCNNYSITNLLTISNPLNVNLINGVFYIHPVLVIYLQIFFIVLSIVVLKLLSYNKFYRGVSMVNVGICKIITLIPIMSLILGSY